MTITKDKAGALIFLMFSICYGYQAYYIPLYPGEEYEVFTSQTMPKVYALFAILISLLALMIAVLNDTKQESLAESEPFNVKGWGQCAALLLLMLFYGATLEPLGFVLSTILFLNIGYLIMGERRIKRLLLASVPVVVIFWLIITKLLGIYLATGNIWDFLG